MNVANPTLGDMVRGGAAAKPWVPPKWLNRIARHPAIRLAFLLKEADADIEQIISNPGNQAALALLNHPTAQQIIADNHLLYGQQKGLAGLASLFTAGKYGIKFEASELLPGLSDTLSIAAGYPIDAGTLTPEEALAILDSYAAKIAAKSEVTAENVRVVAARKVDCFNYPEGATPEEKAEFRRQLKMQEDALNQNPIQDTLNRLNNRLPRDTNAQQKYRDKNGPRWITDRTDDIREIYGLSEAAAFAKASAEFAAQAVLHRIDMIAGGLPTDFGGFGNSRINSSIGAQWKGGRREQLKQALEEQQADGKKRPQITLEIC
jgi:hypothetical protein